MAAEKLSVSFEAKLAGEVRKAAAQEGMSVSEWLADAAAAKTRQRHLREALDEFAKEHGALTEAEIDALIEDARKSTVVVRRRSKKVPAKRKRKAA